MSAHQLSTGGAIGARRWGGFGADARVDARIQRSGFRRQSILRENGMASKQPARELGRDRVEQPAPRAADLGSRSKPHDVSFE